MKIYLSTLLVIASLMIHAQNDGIRGYGNLEVIELNTNGGKGYINGGGGLIINNNIIFGVYLSASSTPFRWDFFTALNNPQFAQAPLSVNEFATNTTITNVDYGANIGFNISPAKPFQMTLSAKFGYANINYIESYIDENVDLEDPNLETLPILSIDLVHANFSLSPQFEIQFRIGGAVKVSLLTGYKIQNTKIRVPDVFPEIDNLLVDSNLFGGPYGGIGFTFGNLTK